MSVAVAHQVSPTGAMALAQGATEALHRETTLAVIHAMESLDHDIGAATRAGISDAVEKALADAGVDDVTWELRLVVSGSDVDDVAESIVAEAKAVRAELLVIGARRRSPVGKAFLGSVSQSIILEAEMPVLVVKQPA